MLELRTICVCAALLLSACDSGPEAVPVGDAKPVAVKPDDAKPVVAEKDAKESMTADRLAQARDRMDEGRELAELHRAGKLGDRLATGKLLLVDPKAPADTHLARFYAYTGKLAAPANFAALKTTSGSDGKPARSILQGGEDGPRVAVFRDIEPGPYTVCAVISGPTDPVNEAKLKKAADAMGDGPLSAEKIKAVGAKAEADGYVAQKVDWDAQRVRCKSVEVTDAASRVVVLE